MKTASDYFEEANAASARAIDFERRPYGEAFAEGFRIEARRLRDLGRAAARLIASETAQEGTR